MVRAGDRTAPAHVEADGASDAVVPGVGDVPSWAYTPASAVRPFGHARAPRADPRRLADSHCRPASARRPYPRRRRAARTSSRRTRGGSPRPRPTSRRSTRRATAVAAQARGVTPALAGAVARGAAAPAAVSGELLAGGMVGRGTGSPGWTGFTRVAPRKKESSSPARPARSCFSGMERSGQIRSIRFLRVRRQPRPADEPDRAGRPAPYALPPTSCRSTYGRIPPCL